MNVIDETHIFAFGIGVITSIILNILFKFEAEYPYDMDAIFCPLVSKYSGIIEKFPKKFDERGKKWHL